MSRTFFVVIFTVAVVASYVTLHEAFYNTPDTPVDLTQTISNQQPAPITTTKPVETAEPPVTQPPTVENSVLIEARDRLLEQERRISDLRRLQTERIQQTQVVHPFLLNQKAYDIENLQSQVEQTRDNLNILSQTTQENLEIQRQENQMAKDELDDNIQKAAENIQNIQRQLDYYNMAPPELATGIERQQYLVDLRNALTAQTESLNNLHSQRAILPQTLAAQNRSWQNNVQQSRADLIEQQNTLQQQILNLRQEVYDLQISSQQTNMSLVPLEQQIQNAQKNYEILKNQVSALEGSSAGAPTSTE